VSATLALFQRATPDELIAAVNPALAVPEPLEREFRVALVLTIAAQASLAHDRMFKELATITVPADLRPGLINRLRETIDGCEAAIRQIEQSQP
jgi:hypothetical protein